MLIQIRRFVCLVSTLAAFPVSAQLGQSASGTLASTQPTLQSEIAVQSIGDDSFRLVLKSYNSSTVGAGQQELLPKAKEVCGAKTVSYGKYQFKTMEPVGPTTASGTFLVLTQDITCGLSAGTQLSAAPTIVRDERWRPTDAQVQHVERQSNTYFAAKDGRRYKDAYELLSTSAKQITSFERWSSVAQNFNSKAGEVLHQDIKKITWYKNPPQAAPGTYAAVDFSSQFANVNIHCGYLVWFEQGDGSFVMVREEENFIDKVMEQKMNPNELVRVRSEFGCKG